MYEPTLYKINSCIVRMAFSFFLDWLSFGLASGLLGDSNNPVVNAVNDAGILL